MFVQNFIKLSATVHELSWSQRKNFATMLKTIMSPLRRTVKIPQNKTTGGVCCRRRLPFITERSVAL